MFYLTGQRIWDDELTHAQNYSINMDTFVPKAELSRTTSLLYRRDRCPIFRRWMTATWQMGIRKQSWNESFGQIGNQAIRSTCM